MRHPQALSNACTANLFRMNLTNHAKAAPAGSEKKFAMADSEVEFARENCQSAPPALSGLQ
jgi:hypothetical protein